MVLKTLTAVAAAALLALSSAALAQSSGTGTASGSSDKATAPSTGGTADPAAKCAAKSGAEREKCMRELRSGAGTTAPAPTAPAPGGMGSSTGSSGKQ